MGADSQESQIDNDVRDLIVGLERELIAANKHRLALEGHRVSEWFNRNEVRLLRSLRLVALVGLTVIAAGIVYLWTVNALLAMAAIPVAPLALLALVLGAEQFFRRMQTPLAAHFG